MAGVYFTLAIISIICTFTAVVQARRLYWMVPVYFLTAWLAGELAMIHLLWQVALTAVLAFGGVFSDPLAQCGLGLFALSWLGLVYLHCQAMDSAQYLRAALHRALGVDFRSSIAPERRALLTSDIVTRSWLKPFHFPRDGVRVHSHLSYGEAGKRNLLDVYQPVNSRAGGFPVLLQVHGGAWMIGEKEQQGKPLMYHLAMATGGRNSRRYTAGPMTTPYPEPKKILFPRITR